MWPTLVDSAIGTDKMKVQLGLDNLEAFIHLVFEKSVSRSEKFGEQFSPREKQQ